MTLWHAPGLFLISPGSLLFVANAVSAQGPEGTWVGTLGTGDTRVSLIFGVERGDDESLTGTLMSLDRGTTNPIESIRIGPSRQVRMHVSRIEGRYEGVVNRNGQTIDGVWIQPGRRTALTLRRYAGAGRHSNGLGVQVDAFVPDPPRAVRAGGRVLVAYEVHITNWNTEDIALQRLEALIGDETAIIDGDTLKRVTVGQQTTLPPGVRTVVLMFLSSNDAFPSVIRHRLTVKRATQPSPVTIECARTSVDNDDVVRISPPVRGRGWWVGSGPDRLHHRASVEAWDGRMTVATRFAFDFARQVSGGDEFSQGDPRNNRNHASCGADVAAVAHGTVVSVRDGMPDNVPYDILPAAPIRQREDALGNHVVLDLGQGHYAVYGHLQRQSVQVRPRQKVQRGQVLGRIGNSGRSDAPHLHFHLVDGKDPLRLKAFPMFSTPSDGMASSTGTSCPCQAG